MKLKLINHTPSPDMTVYRAARCCYMAGDVTEMVEVDADKVSKFIDKLVSSGHESPLEHVSFTFAVSGISRVCYDKQTQILTYNGWKYFADLEEGEIVATLNPETNLVEFHPVVERIAYKYSGEMHHYKSTNVDLAVTPSHRLYIKKYDARTKVDYALVPSQDITCNRFYMTKEFNYDAHELPKDILIEGFEYERKLNNGKTKTMKTKDLFFDKDLFARFMAIYLSEGSVYYNADEGSYQINIAQKDMTKNIKTRAEIKEVLEYMGMKPCCSDKGISFKNRTLGKMLKSLGHAEEKYFPFNIFEYFDTYRARIFIETYLRYDGSVNTKNCNHRNIYTTSEKLKDQIQTICCIAGIATSVYIDDRVGKYHYINNQKVQHNHKDYNISLSDKRNIHPVVKRDKHFSTEPYEDMVYCVDVPNHIIFVKRNNLAVWCGNCTHELVRHRIASYSQQSMRYVNFRHKDIEKDMFIPKEIRELPAASEAYKQAIAESIAAYNKLIDLGIKPQDARYILPNAMPSQIVFTMNARSLLNFFKLRCCRRAQPEIIDLATTMLMAVRKAAPAIFRHAGPPCWRLEPCHEANKPDECKKIYEYKKAKGEN